MSQASNYLENTLVNFLFRDATFSKPSALYVALCTAAVTDAHTAATMTEVSGGSYARVSVPPDDDNWAATSGTDGVTSNVNVITFPTSSGSWGTVTHFALVDSSSGAGNIWVYGSLSTSKTVSTSDVFTFPAGALQVTIA